MDMGRAPQRVVAAHLPDQIADLAGDPRSAWFAAAHFPGPEQTKALAMPRDDGLRPDDGQRRALVLPNARRTTHKQRSAGVKRGRGTDRFKDVELVAEGEVLQFQRDAGAEGRPKNGEESWQDRHRKRVTARRVNSIISSSSDFAVGTGGEAA
jgi:hypothetical protein